MIVSRLVEPQTLALSILPQPDDATCGPTCLHAVYGYYGDHLPLEDVIAEAPTLPGGGTLGAYLGCHALRRGYKAKLYTFDLSVFDVTWFAPGIELSAKLTEQLAVKTGRRLHQASAAYLEFLRLGGQIRFEDLTAPLIRDILKRGRPILAGLSATYLYRTPRERDVAGKTVFDDLRGKPSGHFVVINGYDSSARVTHIADPLLPNPISRSQYYEVTLNHLVCAVMLGVITDDANLLVLSPRKKSRSEDRQRSL